MNPMDEKMQKPRYSLIPWRGMDEIAAVFTVGADKYGDNNWRRCDFHIFMDALGRHVAAYLGGELADNEDGFSHLSHIVANCLIMMEKRINATEV